MASATPNSVFPDIAQISSKNPSCISRSSIVITAPARRMVTSVAALQYQNYWSNRNQRRKREQGAADGFTFTASVAFNPQGNYDLSLLEQDDEQSKVAPPLPPTEGRFEVIIDTEIIRSLNLAPFQTATGISSPLTVDDPREFLERTIGFNINYTREDAYDPRELSEFPDIRLWFVRLDSVYPWLPVLLDWRAGELARYAAMLVPHQMSMRMGVVFNPEALELFVMNKVFVVYSWLKQQGVPKPRVKTADMARMLGFGIGDELFDLIDRQPFPS